MVKKSLRRDDGNEHLSARSVLGATRQPIWNIFHQHNAKSKEVHRNAPRLERIYFDFEEGGSRSNFYEKYTLKGNFY